MSTPSLLTGEELEAADSLAGRGPAGRIRVTLRRVAGNKAAMTGLIVIVLLFLLAFVGPHLTRWSYSDIDYTSIRQGPSGRHWWGTDGIGHDVFAQTVRGLQKSLLIGLLVALFSTVVASLVGACAGYFGGWADRSLMFLVDLLLVFPSFLIIAIVSPRLKSAGWIAFVGLLAIFGWMITARVVRSMSLSLKEREFVYAARFMGVSPFRIIVGHIIPNVASFLIIDATIAVGGAVMSETGLSYFGFGVQPPDVSLGTLIASGTESAVTYPWMFFWAAGLLVVFVLAVNLVGDGLRDALDPTSGRVRRRAEPGRRPRLVGTAGVADPVAEDGPPPLLAVRELRVGFAGRGQDPAPAVRGISFDLHRGEVLGIVGESGSGKSATLLAMLGLLPGSARVGGSVRLDGLELIGAPHNTLAGVRGNRVSMIFQDPLSAFTPVYRIGDQLAEALRTHQDMSAAKARERAIELLDLVGIPEPAVRVDAFPHEFSGGMRQRAMIAMAIANDPDVILADEPTTALDVTIQAQVLDVLRLAQRETGAALVFVSHDLGVIAGFADRVAVMYAGRIVETAPVEELFARPRMPYTLGLIGAVPRLDAATGRQPLVPIPGAPPRMTNLPGGCPFAPRCPLVVDACLDSEPVLVGAGEHRAACVRAEEIVARELSPADVFTVPPAAPVAAGVDQPVVLSVEGLAKTFPLLKGSVFKRRVGSVYAVDGVDLTIRRGETLGLVGESGSGKSTTLFELIGLTAPEAGRISLLGESYAELSPRRAAELRGEAQIVFQDPMASLDPRLPVGDIIAEPLRAAGAPRSRIAARIPELLELVGLERRHAEAFPHEFSGGQRQRIGIARALAVDPQLLVLDEPVSALDVSIQAGVLNLLQQLKAELGLAYLFVSHDLSVIRHIADRVSVLYLGRTVEAGSVEAVFNRALHPYTQALLSAVPIPDPARERARERVLLHGDPPSPTKRQVGCRFADRCPVFAGLGDADRNRCRTEVPTLIPRTEPVRDHVTACHFPAVRNVV